jgi:nucleotide-binding universal stress UspA family protein
MEDIKRILVLSRSTKHCRKAVHCGIALAKTYGADLYVLHIFHDPFCLKGWNLPIALGTLQEEYKKMQASARSALDEVIRSEQRQGRPIKVEESLPKEYRPMKFLTLLKKKRQIWLSCLVPKSGI